MNLKERAHQLKKDIPAVYIALKDAQTPLSAKVLASVTVAYALSPIDLIPDFIPVLGQLDDVLLLPGLIALTIKLIPAEVMTRARQQSEDLWKDGRPKSWKYAMPVIIVWLLVIGLILKPILKLILKRV